MSEPSETLTNVSDVKMSSENRFSFFFFSHDEFVTASREESNVFSLVFFCKKKMLTCLASVRVRVRAYTPHLTTRAKTFTVNTLNPRHLDPKNRCHLVQIGSKIEAFLIRSCCISTA